MRQQVGTSPWKRKTQQRHPSTAPHLPQADAAPSSLSPVRKHARKALGTQSACSFITSCSVLLKKIIPKGRARLSVTIESRDVPQWGKD